MFDKLKQFSQLAGMLGNVSKLQEEMQRFQEKLGQITAEGDAGAGMVKVRLNGKFEMVACTLTDEAFKLGDRELLQELILAASNQAMERVREQVAEATGKMAGNMGLPAGMGLPLPGS